MNPMTTMRERPDRPATAGKGRREKLALTLASVAVGLVMAVLYRLASSHSQLWLSSRAGSKVALLAVGGFLGRITLAGLFLVALHFLTTLNVVAVAVAFVSLFTVLSGYALYRYATKGSGSGLSSHVLP